MDWHNPPQRWTELSRALRGGPSEAPASMRRTRRAPALPAEPPPGAVPYAELHAHSSFSFLDGASSPEELLAEAERLGLTALAITDHDGFYGAARLAERAENSPVQTVFGAELSLGLTTPQNGNPDPEGEHLLFLARGAEGYHRLSGAITRAQLRGAEKGRPVYDLEELAAAAGGHWSVLTGCRKGAVRRGLSQGDAETPLRMLIDLFGQDAVVVELTDHGHPEDTRRNDALAGLAAAHGLPVVATNNVHYATPARAGLAEAVAAVRAVRSLDDLDGWLPGHAGAHLRSGAEMTARFARYPGAIAAGLEIAAECAFPLRRARPALPRPELEPGETPMRRLRRLVWEAVPETHPRLTPEGRARIERELRVIEEKDFPGYFLIVHEIVAEARRRGILCQGRGSAAASVVCHLLGITAIDPILYGLPFERFLATTREEEPDIDVDFDSDRREEIIQWVYGHYDRDRAAQVATVIQYRPKNAVRDMARALGYAPGQQDAWARQVEGWRMLEPPDDHDIPVQVLDYATQLLQAPRHLGIHSGGMVLTARPVGEVVPVEHARMENRTVIQWDKDDAAWMGLVKFDLLGLGMLTALQHGFDLIAGATGETWDLDTIPKEEEGVYDMLCRADAIGVFQVESRAQLGLLPRLRPRNFEDLAAQIALIRPGPIQGGAVHPYVRRRLGQEEVTYPHPSIEPVLARTLGVPIFQEQLIRMATVLGDCSADEADLLRRAMGSKRGEEKIERVRETLYAGMTAKGLDPETADRIYAQIQAFSHFGFAESHALSFALLVYASAWMKLHYPAAFLAALLRSQPMGFYSGATLSGDARRHGVIVRGPDLHASGATETLEPVAGAADGAADGGTTAHRDEAAPGDEAAYENEAAAENEAVAGEETSAGAGDAESMTSSAPRGRDSCLRTPQEKPGPFEPAAPDRSAEHRRDGAFAVRLGLGAVRGISTAFARRIVAEREAHGPFRDLGDLVRRTDATATQLESLASAGAFSCLGLSRREAIWLAGAAAQDRARYLPGTAVAVQPPLFPDQSGFERLAADLLATGISPDDHPIAYFRDWLDGRGALPSQRLPTHDSDGRRVTVAGLVTHRQRPGTASGITFVNLEDEHGMMNVICSAGVWRRYHRVARQAPALVITGQLERSPEGVTNILADTIEELRPGVIHRSRDFR